MEAALAPTGEPPSWGALVSVNRDGSDGASHPLVGDWSTVGRAAHITFADDRFLGRQHARFDRTPHGVTVTPLDKMNGVFRRLTDAVELTSGSMVLCGRELLLFEIVDREEVTPEPLVRHGVAMFGTPPRAPWGRLSQILPNGAPRDVRHLMGDEVVLGREEGELVYRDDAFLSRRHAAFRWDGARAYLADLSSSNGTFIRLDAPRMVATGEHLRMGDQLFRVELRRA